MIRGKHRGMDTTPALGSLKVNNSSYQFSSNIVKTFKITNTKNVKWKLM